jgi:hypothetical protein
VDDIRVCFQADVKHRAQAVHAPDDKSVASPYLFLEFGAIVHTLIKTSQIGHAHREQVYFPLLPIRSKTLKLAQNQV